MKTKKKRTERILLLVFLIIFAGAFAFSAYKLLDSFTEYRRVKTADEEIADSFLFTTAKTEKPVNVDPGTPSTLPTETLSSEDININPSTLSPDDTTALTDVSGQTSEPPQTEDVPQTLPPEDENASIWPDFGVNWDLLLSKNKDVKGWLWIYGTTVNYPVLQGSSNSTYLYTTFDKKYSRLGSIFMDYRISGDMSSRNTLIYGHNGLGLKFGVLMDYTKQSFYNDHKYICLFTPEGMQKYAVYSAYITNIYSNSFNIDFASDGDYTDFIDYTLRLSSISTGIKPTASDKIITLATCTNSYQNERLVIHAVRLKG